MKPNYDEKRVKEIIVKRRAEGVAWRTIEDELTQQCLTTISGLPFQKGSAANWAITKGWVRRVRSTSAGEAGSTGTYSRLNGLAPARKNLKAPKEKEMISDLEIEQIMTSNLETALKLKVIRAIALGKLL